jgi:hypothetical protein
MADKDKSNGGGKDDDKDNNKNKIDLLFVVGGAEKAIPDNNIHHKLSKAAEEALNKTNNLPTNPLEKWMVIYNDSEIDVNSTIDDLKLPNNAKIYMNLRDGQGG